MSTAIETPMLSPEAQFLADRQQGIGGSDVGDIFSVGYGCARKLAYQKIGLAPDFSRTPAQERILRRGKRLEEVVADEYADLNDRKIRRVGSAASKDYSWMRVNMDRIILNDKRGPGYLECKTASPWIYEDMAETGLPEHHALQLQHGLIVKGYSWGAFAVMDMSSFKLLSFERALNPELATVIVAKESEFWKRYVLPSREIVQDNSDAKIESLLPILQLPAQLENPRDRRCASCLYRKTCRGQANIIPDPQQTGYVTDDGLAELGGDYIDALNAVTRHTGVLEEIKERLKVACGDRTGVIIPSISKRIRYKEQRGRLGWDTPALEGAIAGANTLLDLLRKNVAFGMMSETVQLEQSLEIVCSQLQNARKRTQPTRPFYFEEWDGEF